MTTTFTEQARSSTQTAAEPADRMMLRALRGILWITVANAVALSTLALLNPPRGQAMLRTSAVCVVAIVLSGSTLAIANKLGGYIERLPWLPLLPASIGGGMLALAPTASGIMFAAFLTPVGVCALAGYRWRSTFTVLVLALGYFVALHEPGGRASTELAVSDMLPSLAVVFGAITPIRYWLELDKGVAGQIEKFRSEAEELTGRPAPLGLPPRPETARRPALLLGESREPATPEAEAPAQRGRIKGQRPAYSVELDEQIIALLLGSGEPPSPKEIARSVGRPTSTVRARLRAMRRAAGFSNHLPFVERLRLDEAAADAADQRPASTEPDA